MNRRKVLFVCTGNTCRSPMAVALFYQTLREEFPEYIDRIEVDSAGIHTVAGFPASCEAIQVMQEEDLDLATHQSKPVQEELLKEAGLIITMTVAHKEYLACLYPWAASKIHTLKEFAGQGPPSDVIDPFGRGLEAYREAYRELKSLIRDSVYRICTELDDKENEAGTK